jgi:hypothetical protein
MSTIKLPAASGGGSISIKGPASSGSDVDLLDTSGNLKLSDNQKLKIGTGDDLKIWHNGTHSFIENSTGDLQLLGDHIDFWSADGSENILECTKDGSVNLYYNGSKKLETSSAGGTLTGDWIGKVGLQEADEWRITSNVSSADGSLTANWERNDTLGYGHLGTGMSQSGGIWTFPKTGYWLIMYNATASHTDYNRRYVLNRIRGTTDNSNYDNLVDGYGNIMDVPSDATYATVHCTYIFDVTNTSLCKVSFHMQADGAVTWLGSSTRRYTGATFIRLGDT